MQEKAQSTTNNGTPLSDEQWAGLARLGDLGNRIGGLMDGPLAGPAAAALERLGEVDGRYDLAEVAERLVETVSVLERTGLLELLRENAQFVADSLDVIAPLTSTWMEALARLPVEEIKADAAFAFDVLRKLRLLSEFVERNLAGELTGGMVALTEFAQRNQTDQALAEALVQFGRLYRSGLLTRLGDLGEYLAGLDEGTDYESLLGSLVHAMHEGGVERILNLFRSAEEALRDAQADERHLGGYGGMFHLLRDKDVQKGIRMLSILPIYLEKRTQ